MQNQKFRVVCYTKSKTAEGKAKLARRYNVQQIAVEDLDGLVLGHIYTADQLIELLTGKVVMDSMWLDRKFRLYNGKEGIVKGIRLLAEGNKEEKLCFYVQYAEDDIDVINPNKIHSWISDEQFRFIDMTLDQEKLQALEKQDELESIQFKDIRPSGHIVEAQHNNKNGDFLQVTINRCLRPEEYIGMPVYFHGNFGMSIVDDSSSQEDFLSPAQRDAVEDLKSIGEDREPELLDSMNPQDLPKILRAGLPCKNHNWKGHSGGFYGEDWAELWEFINKGIRSQAAGTPKKVRKIDWDHVYNFLSTYYYYVDDMHEEEWAENLLDNLKILITEGSETHWSDAKKYYDRCSMCSQKALSIIDGMCHECCNYYASSLNNQPEDKKPSPYDSVSALNSLREENKRLLRRVDELKALNFSIAYGKTQEGLREQLSSTERPVPKRKKRWWHKFSFISDVLFR